MPVREGDLHAEALRDVGEHKTPYSAVSDLAQSSVGGFSMLRIAQPIEYGTMSASLRLVASQVGPADFSHAHRIEQCRIHFHGRRSRLRKCRPRNKYCSRPVYRFRNRWTVWASSSTKSVDRLFGSPRFAAITLISTDQPEIDNTLPKQHGNGLSRQEAQHP